jgi:hypothetical protein
MERPTATVQPSAYSCADGACADPDARCADDETPTVTVGRAYADGYVHCADGAGPSAQKVVPVVACGRVVRSCRTKSCGRCGLNPRVAYVRVCM